MRMRSLLGTLPIAAAIAALPQTGGAQPDHGSDRAAPGPDDAALIDAARSGEEWLTYGRDYAETRFSPLEQIDADNVGRLGLAWYYDTGSLRGLEATPLVSNGVLYATTSWSNVFALDARTGEELWRWDAQADRTRGSRACCDVVNRGVALYEGKVFVGVIDGRLVALDAATGEPVWQVQTTPVDQPYTITGAPRVVDGKVVIGNGGAELGVRGFVSAYDADTGELVWRFYTVPGDPSKPFESPALEAAAKTWTGEWWKMGGGGTAWDAFAYDPEAGLLYVGTGNGSPWVQSIRSPGGGDNLYLSSILALDVDTGELVWHYQTTPGDTWDYTAVQQLTLADLVIDGRERKVIMQAPKNGFFYVLDRLTGELLSAEPYTHVTWASGVDLETGRPIETSQARFGEALATIFPGPGGGHNWQPMSYNPQTGLVYVPASDSSFAYNLDPDFEFRPNGWNLGVDLAASFGVTGAPALPESAYEPGTGEAPAASFLLAWDPVKQEARWTVPHSDASGGGTLTTAGNLVFQGTDTGRFVAYRADNGEKLWEVDLGHGIMAAPSTYMIDGKQYVSVLSGIGGASALYGRNPTGQYKATGRLWTFTLDGEAELEPVRGIEKPALTVIEHDSTPEQIARGAELYAQRCSMCHGVNAASAGTIADLRYASSATFDAFEQIVRGGAYAGLGMPTFSWLSDADVAALRSYVLSQRDALLESAAN
ncbi:MAG TPA: PQQ-dependent dehydrogenase, methanol/ethanol family [Gammaproteobacteria bacterium]